MMVIDGGSGRFAPKCVKDPSLDTLYNRPIVTQCCEVGPQGEEICRRKVGGECVSGDGLLGRVRGRSFPEAWTECNRHGMQLCAHSCAGQGCYYNECTHQAAD